MFVAKGVEFDEVELDDPLDDASTVGRNFAVAGGVADAVVDCIKKQYPDKEIFGIIPKEEDKIIYTDILFTENSAIDEHGNEKKNFTPKYPNIQFLINQLGDIEKIVIGGYHFADCVKRVGETALAMGVNALVDLDLTDLFFGIYKQKDYFNIEEYIASAKDSFGSRGV